MGQNAPSKEKKKTKKTRGTRENPRETSYPEQGGSTGTDAYNGDDKHGPMEEEIVEKNKV
jgi:hypothetical protein